MKLAEIVTIDKSTEKIKELARSINRKPIVINILGRPNHGKTHLMQKWISELAVNGSLYSVAGENGVDELKNHYNFFDNTSYFLFHTPIDNPLSKSPMFLVDRGLKELKGRGVDLNVLIVNDLRYEIDLMRCKNIYDLIVLNPKSNTKLLKDF